MPPVSGPTVSLVVACYLQRISKAPVICNICITNLLISVRDFTPIYLDIVICIWAMDVMWKCTDYTS